MSEHWRQVFATQTEQKVAAIVQLLSGHRTIETIFATFNESLTTKEGFMASAPQTLVVQFFCRFPILESFEILTFFDAISTQGQRQTRGCPGRRSGRSAPARSRTRRARQRPAQRLRQFERDDGNARFPSLPGHQGPAVLETRDHGRSRFRPLERSLGWRLGIERPREPRFAGRQFQRRRARISWRPVLS